MKLELKWVSIVFLLHILWHVAERMLGLYGDHADLDGYSRLLFMMVYAFIMFLAISDLRNKNKGFLNRRHGFLSGLFISLILVATAPIIVALLMFVIQPGFFDQMIMVATQNGEYQVYEAAAQEYNYWNFVKLYMAGYLLVGSLSAAFFSYLLHKMPEPATD